MKIPCNKLKKQNKYWYDFVVSTSANTPKTRDKVSRMKHVITTRQTLVMDVSSVLSLLNVFWYKTQIMNIIDKPIIKPTGRSKPKYNDLSLTTHLKIKVK